MHTPIASPSTLPSSLLFTGTAPLQKPPQPGSLGLALVSGELRLAASVNPELDFRGHGGLGYSVIWQ